MKNIGVLLAGSGHLDGAEIRESVLTLLALDKAKVQTTIMAPNVDQYHVINHLTGDTMGEKRNILIEASRIARGEIKDVEDVNPNDIDALIMPGGFGVAKNLCDFAFKGPEGSFLPIIQDFIKEINNNNKPIGAICIAPATLSLLFGSKNINVTIGNDKDTAQAIESLGGKHHNCSVTDICVDESLKIVSTPAYMYGDAKTHEVAEGIEKCINKVIELS